MEIGEDRKIWLPEANAGVSLWVGKYKRFTRKWLRWYNEAGWILTDEEEKEQQIVENQQRIAAQQNQLVSEQIEKEKALQEAEMMRKQNERLQAKLKALGIEMNDLNSDDNSDNAR